MHYFQGGCHCGAVRYRVQGDPLRVPICHCSLCRRTSGAPGVPWAVFSAAGFAFTAGTPSRYLLPSGGSRFSCGRCGTPLSYRAGDASVEVDITVVSLDDAARIQPTHHIFVSSMLPWERIADTLPQYPHGKPG